MAFLIPVLGLPILAITIPFVVEQHISNDNDRINDEVAAKFWQRDLHQTYAIPSSQHASDAGAPRHPHADPRKRQSEDWMGIGPVMAPLPTDLWNLTTSKSNWTNANSAQRSESSSQGLARVDAPTLLRFNTTELSDEQMGKFFDSADKSIQLEVHLTKPASHSKREDEDGSQVHEARVKLGDEVMAAEWRVHPVSHSSPPATQRRSVERSTNMIVAEQRRRPSPRPPYLPAFRPHLSNRSRLRPS